MKEIKLFFLLIAVLTSIVSYGQDSSYTLTLDQARGYALIHNRSLLNTKDQVTSSQKKVWETIANGLPQAKAGLDYMTYFNYELNLGFGSTGNINIDPSQLDAGDYEIINALGQMFGPTEPIILNDQLNGQVQVSQLIFSGQYIAGIQTAKIAKKLAEQNVVASELDVKENVTNSYYVILSTEKSLKILRENIQNFNGLLIHTTNLYNAGVAEETDVDQIKVAISQLKNTEKSLERMNQLNYNMLKFQLGVDPEANIKLADSLETITENIDTQFLVQSDYDITQNINYQLTESQVELTKNQVDMTNWEYAPTIAAYYNYTEKFKSTAFDMTPNHLAGVNLSVPIFSSGMRRSKLAQAKINLDIAERNREMVKDQLVIQQNQLLYNYQNALENYLTQKESVDFALNVFNHTKNKFVQGMVSSFELTQANTNYLTAESNYLSAILTLLQAQASLDKLYNRL